MANLLEAWDARGIMLAVSTETLRVSHDQRRHESVPILPEALLLGDDADALYHAADLAVVDAQFPADVGVAVAGHLHFQEAPLLRVKPGEEMFLLVEDHDLLLGARLGIGDGEQPIATGFFLAGLQGETALGRGMDGH